MKYFNKLLGMCLLYMACLLTSCINSEDDLHGKWQLKYDETGTTHAQHADSLFYNFQKGSFSQLCLLKDGTYETFFGNYALKDAEISIILLPESLEHWIYSDYVGWEEGVRTFKIVELSSDVLRLQYEGKEMGFRRY
ncbi:MAG: lipocalin-like domain-containing protein [Bacteroides sp.]|nr:lipocalin-like domain-containing protein [Bacteroides sp.]